MAYCGIVNGILRRHGILWDCEYGTACSTTAGSDVIALIPSPPGWTSSLGVQVGAVEQTTELVTTSSIASRSDSEMRVRHKAHLGVSSMAEAACTAPAKQKM